MNPADERWVQNLFETNAPLIYKVAARRLESESAAENIVQETFLALVEKIDVVKRHPNPSGWLMKAAQYLILQTIRESGRQSEHEVPMDGAALSKGTPFEEPESLRDLLPEGLTQREREMLIWLYEDGLSYEEIAARRGITVVTCRTQMFRARQHCKKLLAEEKFLD